MELTTNGPRMQSAASPVKAEAPVKDQGCESPEGFFMKASGVVRPVMNAPFQRVRPCPKRALKSPTKSLVLRLRNFHRRLPETADGYHPGASFPLETAAVTAYLSFASARYLKA